MKWVITDDVMPIHIREVSRAIIGSLDSHGKEVIEELVSLLVVPEVEMDELSYSRVDLYFTKNFSLGNFDTGLFIRIFNLFDRLNEEDVYTDTGRATYSLDPIYTAEDQPRGLNTLDQYLARPHFYSQPRLVQLGLEFNF